MLAGNAAAAHSYPRLCNICFAPLDEVDLEVLSRWDLLVLGKRAEDLHRAELSQLRAYNPDITIIAHMAVGYSRDFDSPPINADLSDAITTNGWWMRDTSGGRVAFGGGNLLLNMTLDCPTNGEGLRLCDWLPTYIAERLYQGGRWDGLFLDYSVDRVGWLDNHIPYPIDHDLDGEPAPKEVIDESWRLGMRHCVTELRALVGDDFTLVCNGNNTLYDLCDGDTREDFPEMHGDWYANMMNEEHGYLAFEALYRKPTTNIINGIWDGDVLPDGTPARWGDFDREFLFGLSSTLVFGGGYYSCDGPGHTETWWFEEYYDIELGAPLGRCEDVDLRTVEYLPTLDLVELIKMRRFENGIALCNPTLWNQEIALGGAYYDVHSWNGEFYEQSGIRTQIEVGYQNGEVLVGTGVVPEHRIDAANAQLSRDTVILSWEAVDGAERYSVYRCKVGGDGSQGPKTLLGVTGALLFTDGTIISAEDYRYFIAPIDELDCEGRLSRAIEVSTEPESDQSTELVVDEFSAEPAPGEPGTNYPQEPVHPRVTVLTGVWPQPATGAHGATVSFSTADDERWGDVSPTFLTIYDVSGRLVRRLHEGPLGPGEHERHWDLRTDSGTPVGSGCYLVVLERGEARAVSKALVLR